MKSLHKSITLEIISIKVKQVINIINNLIMLIGWSMSHEQTKVCSVKGRKISHGKKLLFFMEDLMSLNDDVLSDVNQYWTPPMRRLPPFLWVRIKNDLKEYIVTRYGCLNLNIYWHIISSCTLIFKKHIRKVMLYIWKIQETHLIRDDVWF